MVEYGYINENGFLISKMLEEYIEKYRDEEDGKMKERIVTVEEQANTLSALGWKPVDRVDDGKLQCHENNCVHIKPYDNVDKISYRYEEEFDTNSVKKQISKLKSSLTSNDSEIGDYRITKCYEASLLSKELPYDVADLYKKRQYVRDEINRLEGLISSNA